MFWQGHGYTDYLFFKVCRDTPDSSHGTGYVFPSSIVLLVAAVEFSFFNPFLHKIQMIRSRPVKVLYCGLYKWIGLLSAVHAPPLAMLAEISKGLSYHILVSPCCTVVHVRAKHQRKQ